MATVLVVDDEPDIRLFAKVNLEMSGHQVVTAADGEGALAAIHDSPPDVVLLDVMMPGLDGWGVLARLKAEPDEAVRTVPVIMMTALGGDHDQARGGIEGAVRYLVKPVDLDDLLSAVGEALSGEPEPVQRRRAQHRALERLARAERGGDGMAGPRPRLTRLEQPKPAEQPPLTGAPPRAGELDPSLLTAKQRELVAALGRNPSVATVAAELGTSRSNIYASLRRIGRKLGVADASELLHRLRAGRLELPPPA